MNSAKDPSPTPSASSALSSSGMLIALASVVCFSASVLLVKTVHTQHGLSFWVITLPRFIVGLLIVKLLFKGEQSVKWISLVTSPWMIARGLIGGAGTIAYNLCIVEIGAGRTSMLTSAYPIFGILIAPLVLPETLRWKTIALSLIAIAGIAIMTGYEAFDTKLNPFDFLAIAVAVASGFAVIAIRKLHGSANTATIFSSQCAYGLAFCLPGAILSFESISLSAVALLMATAVSVALGQILLTQSFKTLSVAKGSVLQLIGPPLVVVGSFLFLGESIGLPDIIGGSVILTACYLIAKNKE